MQAFNKGKADASLAIKTSLQRDIELLNSWQFKQ
jgi:hypothetical protein